MQVLEVMAEGQGPVSLAAISTRLQVPKTSAMYLLRALEQAAYIQRTPTGFQLGVSSYRLAAKIRTANGFEKASQQVLQELLDTTKETILLGGFTEDQRAAVYTTRYPSPQSVRFAPEVGEQRPLYASGLGKLLLAFSPDEFVADYLRKVKLEKLTDSTVSSKQALKAQLAVVRATGVSSSIDEMAHGGSALAAPVFDQQGKLHCGLLIAAPTARMKAHRAMFEAVLSESAVRLSTLLGYVQT